jgi:hypothetical protein
MAAQARGSLAPRRISREGLADFLETRAGRGVYGRSIQRGTRADAVRTANRAGLPTRGSPLSGPRINDGSSVQKVNVIAIAAAINAIEAHHTH